MSDLDLLSLEGKTCLVTGANGGIGQATAELFAGLGAEVLTTDLEADFSGRVATQHRAFDLGCEQSLAECCQWIAQHSPDVLFNNAAMFDMGDVLQADIHQYQRLFDINVKALFVIMQAVARTLVEQKRPGTLINLASQAGHRGEALVMHYCASKAAVISYTQSAALALAPHGIRVNAISPGVIDTPMWEKVDALFAKFEHKPQGQKKIEVGQAVPLGYMGQPRDVARAAAFLASDLSAYMTAQTLSVDGGNVLR